MCEPADLERGRERLRSMRKMVGWPGAGEGEDSGTPANNRYSGARRMLLTLHPELADEVLFEEEAERDRGGRKRMAAGRMY